MTKRLWSLSIVCLLVSSCGVPLAKPFQDPSSNQHPYPEATSTSIEVSRGLAEFQTGKDAARSNYLRPLSPTNTPSSSKQPTAIPTPLSPRPSPASTPSLKPKSSPRKAATQPYASKRPSLPVQKSQGQARIIQKKLTLSQLVVKYPDTFKLRGSKPGEESSFNL